MILNKWVAQMIKNQGFNLADLINLLFIKLLAIKFIMEFLKKIT